VTTHPTGPAARLPRGRNARGQGGRLRTEILAAAAALLDETGDESAVTLRAVARRAGITAPAIYGHFADRQEVLLAVVQEAFAELTQALGAAGGELRAVCAAYLGFAADHPQRYRAMFGGLWSARRAVDDAAITPAQATGLGQDALAVLVAALEEEVCTGSSTSTDPTADAVALWLGLHGLAHQRAVAPEFPWPPGIADRLVASLARLTA